MTDRPVTDRLSSAAGLPENVARPAFTPADHDVGIVHLGLGAFHKAHQAVYTDDALGAAGGDWRITAVSLRSPTAKTELGPQNGLYTCITRGPQGDAARVIGAIANALHLDQDRAAIEAALRSPKTRIVTVTVTEKGYGIDRATGGIDRGHPAIAADLTNPDRPTGLAGLIVQALGARRKCGHPPFAVLSCDNLPDNGLLLAGLIVDFARHIDPDLADFIHQNVAFPASMVDRITPAPTPATRDLAAGLTGFRDAAAVECEEFRQWVIEDDFPLGRPAWDAGGAEFVRDVGPFEGMKLRMLNGAHSMLAYTGFLVDCKYVRDVMLEADLKSLVARHLGDAAATVDGISDQSLDRYAEVLLQRFSNPEIAHETYQIAMDGSEKMPQRIFAPALDARRKGAHIRSFAFATAAWMRYTLGVTDAGVTYALRDPREGELKGGPDTPSAAELSARLNGVPNLIPSALSSDPIWHGAVNSVLQRMLSDGVRAALREALDNSD